LPLFYRGDDRRDVVVGEHNVRRLFRHLRSPAAHRDADVGSAQRRRIIDSVAGDDDDLAGTPEERGDAELLCRVDARQHRVAAQPLEQFAIRRPVHVVAVEDLQFAAAEADAVGDRARGAWMVTGEHHDADASAAAGGDRGGHFWPRRVLHADKPGDLRSGAVVAGEQQDAFASLRGLLDRGCERRSCGRTHACEDRFRGALRGFKFAAT
jgi:hypothetical protein